MEVSCPPLRVQGSTSGYDSEEQVLFSSGAEWTGWQGAQHRDQLEHARPCLGLRPLSLHGERLPHGLLDCDLGTRVARWSIAQ